MLIIDDKTALFPMGQVLMTQGASEAISLPVAFDLLLRHSSGDYGDICSENKESNAEALERGFRIFSAYNLPSKTIWIITEADRASTTILLPSEY